MDRKPVFSIFPPRPTSPAAESTSRPSTDTTRSSFHQSPYPDPSSPLPSAPKPDPTAQQFPSSPQQPLPTTPDSLRPARYPSRRKQDPTSPSPGLAHFHRELARTQKRASPEPIASASSQAPIPRRRTTSSSSSSSSSSRQSNRPPDPDMHSSALSVSFSTSSSSSLSKPPISSTGTTAVGTTPPPGQQQQHHHRPKTVYFHGGIGGAGNYRKVIRENARAPRAYAENAEPVGRRTSPTGFFSSLFGGTQRGRRVGAPAVGTGRGSIEDRMSGSEDGYREEVSLGVAEVMRRKLVGGAWRKRGS